MPELVPTWERLVELAGGGDIEARALSLWCPPAYIAGCSQAVWIDPLRRPRPGAGAQLRLRPGLAGRQLAGHPLVRPAGAGHGRLSMGSAGWHERGGPGRFTELRRQNANRQGLRHPAGDALPAGGIEHGTGCLRDPQTPPRTHVVQHHAARHFRKLGHRVRRTRRSPLCQSPAGGHQLPAQGRLAAARQGNLCRRALRRPGTLVDKKHSLLELTTALLQPPLFQTSYRRGYGTLYSAVYQPTDRRVELLWQDQRWQQSCSRRMPASATSCSRAARTEADR
jgi:hypothetical protein